MADKEMTYSYTVNGEKVSEKMFEMFKRLTLPLPAYVALFEQCRQHGLVPLTSVADTQIADYMEDLGMPAFKLSSEDFINIPLIDHVAQKKYR